MPATEATYRDLKKLHVLFGVSSLALLGAILWMIAADHMREWKRVQRDFLIVDARRLEYELQQQEQAIDRQKLAQLEQRRAEALQKIAQRQDEIDALQDELDHLEGQAQLARQRRLIMQAERDSLVSLIEIAKDEGDEEEVQALRAELQEVLRQLEQMRKQEEDAQRAVEQKQKELDEKRKELLEAERERKSLLRDIERLRESLEAKKWEWDEAVRSWPILDAFASPVRVEQTVHDDLPMDFHFTGVPRTDRCTTCHKGIDMVRADGSPLYTEALLEQLNAKQSPYWRAFLTHPKPELYTAANSPHPRETFGCTICHAGQGSGTTFTYASHSPNSLTQEHQWQTKYGWHEVHFWEDPMLPKRFYESSCLKCHVHVVDLEHHPKYGEPAPKLLRGYHLVRQYGCFGCHEINGYAAGRRIGPDLRLEPQTEAERQRAEADPNQPPGTMRKVGPSLRYIAEKTAQDWVERWIKHPAAFRPSTRMPRFYGLSNNDGATAGSDPTDLLRTDVEIYAITYYLYQKSEPLNLPEPPVKIDPADAAQVQRGRTKFIEQGCLACHTHRAVQEDLPAATADFGPDLSDLRLKLLDADGKPNTRWLYHWLKNPKQINPRGFMPELKLTDQDAADIAAWLLSVEADWHQPVELKPLDSAEIQQTIDEMIYMYLERNFTLEQTQRAISEGLREDELPPSGPERLLIAPITPQKKLLYLGQKTIGRLGCFGCHDIPGFENAKPIGTPLSDWGRKAFKDPEKLEFLHVHEFAKQRGAERWSQEDYEYFLTKLEHHTGIGFLWQKLRYPRSFDYNRDRRWDDKLRMPRFPFADNPEDVEAVMTFVLGLVQDTLTAPARRALPDPVQLAKIEGWKAITRYNCAGCHVFRMPEIAFDATKMAMDVPLARHNEEFPEVLRAQKQMARDARLPHAENLYRVQGLLLGEVPPLSLPEEAGEEVVSIELWEPMKWQDTVLMVGDRVPVDDPAGIHLDLSRPAIGGQYAELLVQWLSQRERKRYDEVWPFVPPPLVRQGMRTQPSWTHRFLLDPFRIRPAARLRMPKFHLSDAEAAAISRYFAIVDGAEEPYEHVPEREEQYVRQREVQKKGYWRSAWNLLTMRPQEGAPQGQAGQQARLCASCHRIGTVYPAGGRPEETGPDLHVVGNRLRSEYLWQWIASPKRLLPYTGMPANFDPRNLQFQDVFSGPSIEQVIAVKDVLMNFEYVEYEVVRGREGQQQPAASGGE